jgi:hypothetical protein
MVHPQFSLRYATRILTAGGVAQIMTMQADVIRIEPSTGERH